MRKPSTANAQVSCMETRQWHTRIDQTETKRIDIRWLQRSGYFKVGAQGEMCWIEKGHPLGTIAFKVSEHGLHLSYRYKDANERWQSIREHVEVTHFPADRHLRTPRFICPRCRGESDVLNGHGELFLCPHCHQFPYGSLRSRGMEEVSSALMERQRSPDDPVCEFQLTVFEANASQPQKTQTPSAS